MPKVKTKKITRKRFKITKNGKLIRRVQGRRHLRAKKSHSQKRRQDRPTGLDSHALTKTVKRFMQT